MSDYTPYLDGFLAAARPADRPTGIPPPEEQAKDALAPPLDPLSFEEETKRRLHPLESFERLLDCALANRPPDAEDRFRFQWFGLFYQAPAQDAFTLRLRLPGGRLQPFQLAGLAEITQRFAGGQVVLNARGGLDVPGVPVPSTVDILSGVGSIGLSARGAGGDCVQAIRGGEFDGASPERNFPPLYPLVCLLEQVVSCGSVYADLPRPCEIVLRTAGWYTVCNPAVDALMLQQVTAKDVSELRNSGDAKTSAFVLLLPGEPRGGLLLPPDSVVPVCAALLKGWASSADRSDRANTGLAGFLSDFDFDALTRGAKRVPMPPRSGPGPGELNLGIVIPGDRLLSGQLAALERCCREHGWREIRLAGGRLHAVGPNGEWLQAAKALEHALSA